MKRAGLLCLLPWVLGACAPPAVLSGGSFAQVTVQEAQATDLAGQRVRWGGGIVATTPEKEQTCFEVVSRPLDRQAEPRLTDQSDGRFLACAVGFFDPAVYAAGRDITVVGILETPTVRQIGAYEYRYPRVAASAVFLWPKREPLPPYYFYGAPYGPWPDAFWYPAWGPWPYW